MEDAELIRQILTGQHDQYALLVERYQRGLVHFVRRLLNSDEDAYDCTQEAFLAAYRNLGRYSDKYTFRAWLYAIARNKAIDMLRQKRENVSLDAQANFYADSQLGPEEIWLAKEQTAFLHQVLQKLPDHYRQALYLRYRQELSYEEVAVVLEVPVSRVKTYLHRGKEKLRRELEQRGMVQNEFLG